MAPDPAQCSGQPLGGRTEIRTQIRLTGAEATNPGIGFSGSLSFLSLHLTALLVSASRAPRGSSWVDAQTHHPSSQACLGVHRCPMGSQKTAPNPTHTVLSVILLTETRGGREGAPLNWS